MKGLAVGLLLFFALPAQAARLAVSLTPPFVVRMERLTLMWPWTQGEGGEARFFTVKCGPESGTYTLTIPLLDPTLRSFALSSVITETGQYFCVTSASNEAGESANSEEMHFTVHTLEAP